MMQVSDDDPEVRVIALEMETQDESGMQFGCKLAEMNIGSVGKSISRMVRSPRNLHGRDDYAI